MRVMCLLLLLAGCGVRDDAPASGAERSAAVATLATLIDSHYVDPAQGTRLAALLRARGASDAAGDDAAFAARLSAALLAVSHDPRLRVRTSAAPARSWLARLRERGGIESVARIGADIGYLDVAEFTDAERAARPYARAFSTLGDVHTLIVDLRRNRGGDPQGLRLLSSYVVDRPIHYAQVAHRGGGVGHSWALPQLAAAPYLDQLTILTGLETGAEAEAFAYTMQAYRRATVIGTRSAGVASAGRTHALGAHLLADIPDGRPVLPLTGASWHGSGVAPDVEVRGDALRAAKRLALEARLARATTPMGRAALRALLDDL